MEIQPYHDLSILLLSHKYEYVKGLNGQPETEPWGQRTCYIADPEGNLIEIGSFNKPFRS